MPDQKAAEKALHDQTNLLPKAQLLTVFGILSLSLLITFIDQNGISVALPTIADELDAEATISWAGTSSLIANTVFSVLYGRLSDLFGRKAMFIGAAGLLAIADLLCGLSQNSPMFYVFRAFAGVAGGGITNLTMILVSDIVTLEERGIYQGILGAWVGLGNVLGPFLAAAFITKSTWRGYFYLLAPLAAMCGGAALWLLPSNAPKDNFRQTVKKIDVLGVFTSSVGIIFLLIPISGGGAYFPWNSPLVISFLTIGALALVMFVLIEWKIAQLPMMPIQLFKSSVITTLLVQSFLLGIVYQSYLYYLPIYFQNVRRYSVIASAALMSPIVVFQMFGSIFSGQYISRRKRYGEILWLGFGLWTLGAGLACLFNRTTHPAVIAVILSIVGFGVGNVFQPTLIALQAHATKAQRAVVISNRNFFRCAGGACGLAISAAVLQLVLKQSLPADFAYLATSTYSIPADLGAAENSILNSYMHASRAVFIMQVPIIGVCLLGCLRVEDRGLERPTEENDNLSASSSDEEKGADAEKGFDAENGSASVEMLNGAATVKTDNNAA